MTHPSVVIKLAGIGAATEATLSFGTDSHVYSSSGGTTKTGYSWTADGNCTRYIGYFKSQTMANDNKTPAGDIQATELRLIANSITFTVKLNTPIKIHNPY